MATHPEWIHRLFTEADLDAIALAIGAAERGTAAEIRVHLEREVQGTAAGEPADALGRAQEVFLGLGMHRTAHRSGVLIYLAIEARRVAIVGDAGIHRRVGERYWASIRDAMVDGLRRSEARAAIVGAIGDVGRVLARHVPRHPGDVNELSDTVSIE